MKTKLLQALIPVVTAKRVMDAAKHEGISTGAFIRRMLMEWERDTFGEANAPADRWQCRHCGFLFRLSSDAPECGSGRGHIKPNQEDA